MLQWGLIHALGSSFWAIESNPDLDADSWDALEEAVRDFLESVRHRLFHLFILSVLILEPLPEHATEALTNVAALMQIDDELIDDVREYNQGSYVFAASALHRKGCLVKLRMIKKASEMMRVYKPLMDPFEKMKKIQPLR